MIGGEHDLADLEVAETLPARENGPHLDAGRIHQGHILGRDEKSGCPRQESNLRTRFRKPLLYPLSYEGRGPRSRAWHGLAETPQKTPPDSTVQRSQRF
jgi:hypothetical protein